MEHGCDGDAECDVNGVVHTGVAHHSFGLQPGASLDFVVCVISERAITALYWTPLLPKAK